MGVFMRSTSHYGQRLSDSFRLEEAPSLVIRSLKKTEIAVTDCYSNSPDFQLNTPFPEEDSYIVGLQLRDYEACESWERGRIVSRCDIRAGETHLYDLKQDPRFFMDKPFHMLGFYIPRAVFDAISEESHTSKIGELRYRAGVGTDDEVVRNLGSSMLAALSAPGQASRLFVDHVTFALAAHVAQTYGGLRGQSQRPKGGLAGWQEKRACAMLDANLSGELSLRDIAHECGLSTGHFSRAFRQSTGMTPHYWLLRRRVDVAKSMMFDSHQSLLDISLAAGFADQSHFTRVFSKMVGVSPGAWRRSEVSPSDEPNV